MKFQSKFGETINHHYRRPKHFPIICRKINLKKPNFIACAISSSAIGFRYYALCIHIDLKFISGTSYHGCIKF